MRRPSCFVVYYGDVYRLTERAWVGVLRDLAAKRNPAARFARAKKLGPALAINYTPTTARDALREVLRGADRDRAAAGVPLARHDGRLRWLRLAPGCYRARGVDGSEFEILRTSERREPARWSVRMNNEDTGGTRVPRSKPEAQKRAQELADKRARKNQTRA